MIGVISDTHDNLDAIKKAIKVFKQEGVNFIVHCGDIVYPETVLGFKGIKTRFVLGNCDFDIEGIKKAIRHIKGELLGNIGEFEHLEKKYCVYHGNNRIILARLIHSGKYDYVLTGHTHQSMIKKFKKTVVVNPGSQYFNAEHLVAIIKDKPKLIDL